MLMTTIRRPCPRKSTTMNRKMTTTSLQVNLSLRSRKGKSRQAHAVNTHSDICPIFLEHKSIRSMTRPMKMMKTETRLTLCLSVAKRYACPWALLCEHQDLHNKLNRSTLIQKKLIMMSHCQCSLTWLLEHSPFKTSQMSHHKHNSGLNSHRYKNRHLNSLKYRLKLLWFCKDLQIKILPTIKEILKRFTKFSPKILRDFYVILVNRILELNLGVKTKRLLCLGFTTRTQT